MGKTKICEIHGEAYCSLRAHGKNMFCYPSSSITDPEQVSGSTMTTLRLGHRSGRTQAPLSRTASAPDGYRQGFGSSNSGSQTMEPCVCGSGRLGGRPCASPMGVLPSSARVDVWPIWPIMRRDASPRSDSNSPPTLVGVWIYLGNW